MGLNGFQIKWKNRHQLQLKKSKSWKPFWSYQLNSQFTKWAGLAVLSSRWLQNGLQDFDFFNCHGYQLNNYSFEVKNIEIWVPAFFEDNNSSVATMIAIDWQLDQLKWYFLVGTKRQCWVAMRYKALCHFLSHVRDGKWFKLGCCRGLLFIII